MVDVVEMVKRGLRDGVLGGEQAPAVLLRDTVRTAAGPPLLKHFLRSVCDNVANNVGQAKRVILVALSGAPEWYASLIPVDMKERGFMRRVRLIDCFTDRLAWERDIEKATDRLDVSDSWEHLIYKDIRNLDGLLSLILEGREETCESPSKAKCAVFFDSMSTLLRYHSLQDVMNLLCTLRSHDHVAALCWLLHSDLHDPKVTFAFEYISSTSIAVEPHVEVLSSPTGTEVEGFDEGLARIRLKRGNGKVYEQVQKTYITKDGLRFKSKKIIKPVERVKRKGNVPKVQFSLSLTDKELEDRSRVVLPFEHQGNGQEVKIYDGRESSGMSKTVSSSREMVSVDSVTSALSDGMGLGAVHYLRDSDDERPDSDEDPDDDLDI